MASGVFSPWWLVALGGAGGALCRFAVVRASAGLTALPLGTLIVNVLGCLAAGVLVQWLNQRAPGEAWRLLWQTGFLGAFTTFSAFSVDTLVLIERDQLGLAMGNVLLNTGLCLLAVTLGLWLGRQLF